MAALRYFFSLLMIPFSFLTAGAGLLAFLARYIRPEQCWLCTFAALALPVILGINLLIFIYWILKKRKWAFVPLGGILINLEYMLSIWQFTFFTPDSTGKNSLHIATYNVGKFKSWQHKQTQYDIAYYMKKQQADIVCFQEYWDSSHVNSDSLSHLLNLPYYAVQYLPGSTDLGSIIFSKYPILYSERIPFGESQNDALWADIRVGEKTIRIISCHLQTTNFNSKRKELDPDETGTRKFSQIKTAFQDIVEELKYNFTVRTTQADKIQTLIDTTSYPVLVCGDFNDTPASYTYHRIKGNLSDSFRSNGNGYSYTYRGIKKLLRIDFIFYSSPFQCTAYQSPPVEWSDHKPVFSKLIW